MTELLEIQRAAFLRDGIPDAKPVSTASPGSPRCCSTIPTRSRRH